MAPGLLYDDKYSVSSCVPKHAQPRPRMAGSLVWDGASLQEAEYTYNLTRDDIEEVDGALVVFKSYELDGPDIGPETFPLPNLGRHLESLAREVHDGRGFVVISGLNPDSYSVEDNMLAYLGISSYIGTERGMQDNRGRMMVHVCDRGKGPSGGTKASNKPSPFHTESFCDILSLYVKSEPENGGNLKIVSSQQAYNDLCEERPDIIQSLLKPDWTFESRGNLFPAHTRPLIFLHDDKAILNFSRRPLLGSYKESDATDTGNLTCLQHEALLVLQETASRRCLSLPPRKGSILFINNLAMLHSRDGFSDNATHSRHLVRLWLRNPELAWSLPEALAQGHERVYGENGRVERWDLTPMDPGGARGKRGRKSIVNNPRRRDNGKGDSSGEETSGNDTSDDTSGSDTTPSSTSH